MRTKIRETQIVPVPKGGSAVRVLLTDAVLIEEATLQIAVTVHLPDKDNPRLATVQKDALQTAADEIIAVLKTHLYPRAAMDGHG